MLSSELSQPHWSAPERLIIQTALFTGARKQSVLTLRMKHLRTFNAQNLSKEGTYQITAKPVNGIDTKNMKKQTLHFPAQLAEDLVVYANSPLAETHRDKLRARFAKDFPDLPMIKDEDMYVFLSDQGGAYYMAKNDPRYPIQKYPPSGQVTDTLKRKLLRKMPEGFPGDFTYHWLRATYAYQYFQYLQKYVNDGRITVTDQITLVQGRLHHAHRETTENYLKLFSCIEDRLQAQELFEEHAFGDFMRANYEN